MRPIDKTWAAIRAGADVPAAEAEALTAAYLNAVIETGYVVNALYGPLVDASTGTGPAASAGLVLAVHRCVGADGIDYVCDLGADEARYLAALRTIGGRLDPVIPVIDETIAYGRSLGANPKSADWIGDEAMWKSLFDRYARAAARSERDLVEIAVLEYAAARPRAFVPAMRAVIRDQAFFDDALSS